MGSWSFIPSDAALVIESEVIRDIQIVKGYSIWSVIEESSGFKGLVAGLAFLDSINGEGGFAAIFEEAPLLTSIHKVGSDNLDFLFVAELQNISQNTFVNAAIGRLQKKGYRFKTRNYNDFKISEISHEGKSLTFLFFKNYFIASFTPYLVEDAIRAMINEGSMPRFKETFSRLDNATTGGLTGVYVNYSKASELLGAFINNEYSFPIHSGNYELSLDSGYLQLSGFSYAQEGWLGTHTGQAAPFDMAEVVPEKTAFFTHIAAAEMAQWKTKQVEHLSRDPEVARLHDSLRNRYDFNADQVFDLVDNEIGIATLESPRTRDQQRLMILEVNNVQESLEFFEQLTQRIAVSRGDTVYAESYSDNEIRFLPIQNFPTTLLGTMGKGFDQCFYIGYRNYLIFSNDLVELKSLITSIQNEDTWGKSIQMNNFLSQANQTANVSLFVNVPRAWNTLLSSLKPEWVTKVKQDAGYYKSIELSAFQFSYMDGRYFTNYTFTQPVSRPASIPKTRADDGLRFVNTLTSKPHLIRSHAHKEFDILIQDSTHTVYYLDPNQNTLWSENVEGPIQGGIHAIDYYKNGKLQYAFATPTKIFIIDRTGAAIPGYPKSLPGEVIIDHLNVIDYDLSRNYRMAITDSDGNVFLTDKDLKVLDGWNPKKLDRPALLPLNHARLGSRDVMISIQENGVLNLMNRRGAFISGFPFNINKEVDQNYFLRQSNSLGNSSISVLSTGGELTELTMEGDLIKRDQLIKNSANARFRLIPDTGGNSFLIVRNEGNTYEVLDDTGNLLFQKDYLSDGPILIQYYQFGAGKDLVIFTDLQNKALYIYDKTGNLVTGNPLNASHEVSLIYSSAKREFQVYTTWDTHLELYTFSY